MLAGVEMFFSGQLDLGNIHVQLGIEGLQSTIIPIAMLLLGLLSMLMPQHRIFYGVISLVLSVYSLVGLNLGGFFVGMLLGAVGGILIVSWMATKPAEPEAVTAELATAELAPADSSAPHEFASDASAREPLPLGRRR
jgi:Family of unknown function (DUF6114)